MNMSKKIRIHHFMNESKVNGPGNRAVIWLQGCEKKCPGCFNPDSRDPNGGSLFDIDEIYEKITDLNHKIEGVTFTGGEPMMQSFALLSLIRTIRFNTDLSIMIFTGYPLEELIKMPYVQKILILTDIIVAGPYEKNLPSRHPWASSANQDVIFLSDRYKYMKSDLEGMAAKVEVRITPEGKTFTGFPVITLGDSK